MNINWYPGHMTKTRRALEPKLKLIDLAVQVLDARAPLSTMNPDFDAMLASKKRMVVLNKADMADPAATARWLDYFRARGMHAVSYSAVTGNPQALRREIEACAQSIYDKYAQKGLNKTVRALVCGIPNVGKSAILNRLAGGRKLKEGNQPGVTRGLQWVRLTPYLELMDSPGLLWPKIEDQRAAAIIALIGSIRIEILDEEELAFYLIGLLTQAAPAMLMERYKLENLSGDAWEDLQQICQKRGFLRKKGEVDTDRGAKMLLEEFRNAKIGRLTLELPPTQEETTAEA